MTFLVADVHLRRAPTAGALVWESCAEEGKGKGKRTRQAKESDITRVRHGGMCSIIKVV